MNGLGRLIGVDLHNLPSSAALKAPDGEGMARPGDADGTQRLSSLNLAVAIVVAANSMMSCSQSNAR
jgi:hypothetical protein